jgi:Mn2+/Fe2+ NRAMP family transporter
MEDFYGKLTVLLVCGVFSLIACLFSGYSILQHLRHYTQPNHQRHIVRILLIVPVYAIYSWFALMFYEYQVYFSILRDW